MKKLFCFRTYLPLILISLLSLCACDNGSDSGDPPSPKNSGSVSFAINMNGASQATDTPANADYCLGGDVASIRATLYDTEDNLIVSREWPCDSIPGVIHHVPAPQEDVTLVLVAKNSDNRVVYRGAKGDLTLQAVAENAAGAVELFQFPPPEVTLSNDPVQIQWQSVTGATEYRVVISENEDLKNPAINSHHGGTEFTPMGLTADTLYYVQIYACDNHGTESAGSEIVTFTTAPPPPAPTNISAAGDLYQVTLNWEGGTGALFNVYWSTTPGVTQRNREGQIEQIEDLTLVHDALQGNTTYYYRVSALNDAGQESHLSAEVSATAVGYPDGPENVTAEAGDRKVTLNWTPSEGFVYNIYWSTEPGVSKSNYREKIENIDTATYVHGDCDSTPYYYIVTAKNDLGESNPIGEVTAAPGWIERLGGDGYDSMDSSMIDENGNMYLAGSTDRPFDNMTVLGKSDVYLVKYDRQGVQQWLRSFGTTEDDVVHNMGMDAAGNIYIVGLTEGIWREGITNPGSLIYLLKLNPDGQEEWIQFPIEMTDYEKEMKGNSKIAVDAEGNSYISGGIMTTEGAWDSFDAYTIKYDTDGNQVWSDYLHTRYGDYGSNITLDGEGNPYIVGFTEGDLEGNENSSFANKDVFVAKYAAHNGTLHWLKLLGEIYTDEGFEVAVNGNACFISGYMERPMADSVQADLFLARFTADDGEHEWTTFIEAGRPHTYPSAMTFTPSGNLLMGAASRTASIDGQANAGEPDADGVYTYDALIMTFDPANGDRLWSKFFGSPEDDYAWRGVQVDAEGYAYIGVESSGDFGGHATSGQADVFAWKLYVGP